MYEYYVQIKSNHLFADTNNHHTVGLAQNRTCNNNKFCWLSAVCHRTNGHLCDARCSVLVQEEILNISKIVKFKFQRDALKALEFLKSIIDAGKLFQTFAIRWLKNVYESLCSVHAAV